MEKINFSGGEPFLPERGRYLGEMARYCKEVLKLSSVSIVSNGSMIRKSWFKSYSRYVDILAISCDSFHEDINKVPAHIAVSALQLQLLESHIILLLELFLYKFSC